jgi:CrcB protein
MSTPFDLLALLAGGFLGGVARWAVSGAVARRIGETFPWGTLVVNLTGAFAIGLAAARLGEDPGPLRSALVTGFLGCYTTVSSLSLQSLALARNGEQGRAALNLVLTLLGGLAACAAGLFLGGRLG